MQTPIKIDLRQLTEAHVKEARPNMGKCLYSAPCIIGALLTVEQRKLLDDFREEGIPFYAGESYNVRDLHMHGAIEFAEPDQLNQAEVLQDRFDSDDDESFDERIRELLGAQTAEN